MDNGCWLLSIGYLCKLHKNLFKNVYVDCGIIRSYNVRKREMSLNGETIDYADNHGIKENWLVTSTSEEPCTTVAGADEDKIIY